MRLLTLAEAGRHCTPPVSRSAVAQWKRRGHLEIRSQGGRPFTTVAWAQLAQRKAQRRLARTQKMREAHAARQGVTLAP